MTARHYTLSLLILLSIAAVGKLGMVWYPNAPWSAASTNGLLVISAQAEEPQASTAFSNHTSSANTKQHNAHAALIDSAEASVFSDMSGDNMSHEEADILRNLRPLKEQLDTRAKDLDKRQQAVEEAEKRVASQITELKTMLARIQDSLKQEQGIKSKKIKRLSAVYESMKAEKAASIIAKMDLPVVVKMFSRMNEKKVGKILSFLPPEQAVNVTQALTKQIATLKK